MPRRGGGWLPRNKKKWVEAFPRFVIPSAAEGSFSFTVSVSLRKAARRKHRDPKSHGVRCFPFSAFLPFFLDRERKRFLAFARNDNMGKTAFSDRFPSHAGRLCYRENGILPPSSGRRCPEGAKVGSPRNKEMDRGISSFRHPERSRGIFFVSRFRFPS